MVVEVIIRLTVVVVVLDKKADMEVNQEIDKEVANIVNEEVVEKFWFLWSKY